MPLAGWRGPGKTKFLPCHVRSTNRPDSSAADPTHFGVFLRNFGVATDAPQRERIMSISGFSPGPRATRQERQRPWIPQTMRIMTAAPALGRQPDMMAHR